jgi:hypothetical protein
MAADGFYRQVEQPGGKRGKRDRDPAGETDGYGM